MVRRRRTPTACEPSADPPRRSADAARSLRLVAVVVVAAALGGCIMTKEVARSDDPPASEVDVTETEAADPDPSGAGDRSGSTAGDAAGEAGEEPAVSDADAGHAFIGDRVYEPTFPPPAGDGWTTGDWVDYGSGGAVMHLEGTGRFGLVVPEAVAFDPDQYVEVGFDQGAIQGAPDALIGAGCRFDPADKSFYAVAVGVLGQGASPGSKRYGWFLREMRDGELEVIASDEVGVDASAGPVTVGLTCIDHPDGAQLDVRIGDQWAGGTIDTTPLQGTRPGIYGETVSQSSDIRAFSFTVFEASRNG